MLTKNVLYTVKCVSDFISHFVKLGPSSCPPQKTCVTLLFYNIKYKLGPSSCPPQEKRVTLMFYNIKHKVITKLY